MGDKVNERLLRLQKDPVFGDLHPLKTSQPLQLPTYNEVGKAIAYERARLGMKRTWTGSDSQWSNKEAYEKVVSDLEEIHQQGNIPIYPKYRIMEKVERVWKELRRDKMKIGSHALSSKKKKQGRKKLTIDDVKDKIFDIVDDKNVPNIEKEFLDDQRRERRMWICGVDKKGTKQMLEKEEVAKRREEKLEREESRRKKSEDEMERMFKRVSEISEDEDQ